MAKKAKIPLRGKTPRLKRQHRVCILLNEKELEAIEIYCKKNKIKNRSGFIRETTLRMVMNHFLDDYPTLFARQELDNLVVRHVAEP